MFPRSSQKFAILTAAVLAAAAVPASARVRPQRANRPNAQPPAPAPAAPENVSPAPVPPAWAQTPPTSLWRTWSDPEGHQIEAEFQGLEGDTLTVRTKAGQTYPLHVSKLIPADRDAARAMTHLVPAPAKSVAEAAARVDQAVLAGLTKAGQKPNPPAADESLVRRLYLDIAGRIPTAKETSDFLADKSPDKRAKLIDRLLGSDGYRSQTFNWLADMLRVMDDYGKGLKTFLYEDWLKEQIAQNRPWNGMVYDMLAADGRLTNNGPVGYLLRDRNMPLDSLSNTLTTFLGANVACAQCHNHPLAEWTQRDFYQMASFFGATDTGDLGKRQARQLARNSEFDKNFLLRLVAPNEAEIADTHKNGTKFPGDYKYDDAKPGEPVPPKLIRWSPDDAKNPAYAIDAARPEHLRDEFAKWLTHPENPRFAAAIANRLWKRAFGMAVQEPVTDLDDLSKSANPELLACLANEMKRLDFDLREFQRILFNTQAYQRQASMTPDLGKGPYLFPGPLLRRMTAEQAWDSVLALVVGPDLDRYKLDRADSMRRLNIPAAEITNQAILAKARELKEEQPGGPKRRGGGRRGPGVTAADYEGEPPPRFEGMMLARASELPQPAKESHFLRMFGQSDRQVADSESLEGGVPQVLMMMNGEVQKVIASNASRVLKDAASQAAPERQVESLYFSFLGRRPTIPETAAACRSLKDGLTLADLTWVLFNSREFIFIQ